jgi:hypothetical protein
MEVLPTVSEWIYDAYLGDDLSKSKLYRGQRECFSSQEVTLTIRMEMGQYFSANPGG